ncbi:hypothetical protein PpBr36_07286 [Pyricularia pennisetigena]|uniref:hypothetical protein n=1 Tax=Pyricularia pennisetigena TaxID=1578925 RepID=UPI00115144BC|nr:hypothetical protein PpBr36_07286 [Pyricularia pennisetigena]TLS25702.1 hypothetical protein PpBr36_07286 [Pyricularia pennisetigena]
MHHHLLLAILALRASAKSDIPPGNSPERQPATHCPDDQCGNNHGGTPIILQKRFSQPGCPRPVGRGAAEHHGPRDWAPWTHAPYCVANASYCVLTNAAFQHGSGFSIVATPEGLSRVQGRLESAFAARVGSAGRGSGGGEGAVGDENRNRNRNSNSSTAATTINGWPDHSNPPAPFKIQKVPGKGLGMIATRRIPRGETFLSDFAAMLASAEFPVGLPPAQGDELLERAATQLADPTRVLGLASSGTTRGAALAEDVVRTNSFSLEIDGDEFLGLFPTISRINHACGPNSQVKFDPATLSLRTYAIHNIEAGEEITISYAEFGMPYGTRQSTLQQRWGFKCTCALCSASPGAVAASDARRTRAASVLESITAAVEAGRLLDAIGLGEQLVDISAREGLASGLAVHYEVLTRLHVGVGDLEGAGGYARRALEEMRVFGGSEAYRSFDELDLFVRNLERRTGRG